VGYVRRVWFLQDVWVVHGGCEKFNLGGIGTGRVWVVQGVCG
jgi:hypothetical protein